MPTAIMIRAATEARRFTAAISKASSKNWIASSRSVRRRLDFAGSAEWPNAFTLQTATNVAGPYVDLLSAFNPYTNPITADGLPHFFRLRQ
jgi:hypothetical protein